MTDFEVLAVTADAALIGPAIPLDRLIVLLAGTIARCLRDRVWVVRLTFSPVPPAAPGIPPREAQLNAATLEADLGLFIQGFAAGWSSDIDLLVLDPTALFGGALPNADINPQLVAALASAPAPARMSYLVDDPQQWRDLPYTVGPTAGVEMVPTALLPDGPPDGGPGGAWIQLFDDLVAANLPTPASALNAVTELLQGLFKFHVEGGGSAAGDPNDAWPVDAAKLRLTSGFRQTLAAWNGPLHLDALPLAAELREQVRRNLERWARAVTARRVGLALGGGGALSYVGVALLQRMGELHIPVDVVSGTSFGSVVAAYYAVRGDVGLTAIVRQWFWAQLTVLFGWVTTDPFQLWIDFALGFADVNDLEVTLVPVAADARTGREWHLHIGAVGHVCAASGSLPPLAPTYDGNLRLLDGALTAGVPAAIVAAAGANLVVGANVVPYPPALPGDPALPLPRLWNLVRTLNPLRRLLDFSRGYGMLIRQGGQSQDTHADVVYPADTQGIDGTAFYAGPAIINQALASVPLQDAIAQLEQRWADLLRHPAGRIRFWSVGAVLRLGGALEPCAAADPIDPIAFPDLSAALTPPSLDHLTRVRDAMLATSWLALLIRVDSPGTQALGEARRDSVLGALMGVSSTRLGSHVRYGPGLGETRVTLELWLELASPPTMPSTLVP